MVALLSCLCAVPAYAQDPTPAAPAPAPPNLAFIEGAVDVVQDGVTERADPPTLLLEGDIVRTRDGRAEIVFGDGTLIHLSHDSELEHLGAEHLRIVSGRAIIRVGYAAPRPYVIDTPASSVRLEPQGEYGITTDRSARLELTVARGAATTQDGSAWTIRDGQMLTLAGAGARPVIQMFNSARWDAFTQWAYERTNGYAASYSASQLPYELRPYGPVLDSYGRWDYVAPHGSVWYPSVGVAWRPYYDGSWAFTRFGWTWYGRDRWAWPTHYYGRWGFNGASWFWIPGKVWAPAWVSWNFAPGYVGWSPLGWDNRPAIWWGHGNHPEYWPNYHNPWRSWTVVRRDHFGPRRNVRAHAVDGERLDAPTRDAFARTVPLLPTGDVAVPRSSVPTAGQRDGNVRRPQRSYPSGAGVPARTASAVDERAIADTPAYRSRRPADNPAFASPPGTAGDGAATAPPRSWSSRDGRRGIVRDPAAAPRDRQEGTTDGAAASPGTEGAPFDRSVYVPRSRNGGTPARQTPGSAPDNDRGREPRAVPRARPEGAAPAEPRGANPPPASPPARGGGAVERDSGGQRSPRAGAPSRGSAPANPPPNPGPSGQGGARRRPPQ